VDDGVLPGLTRFDVSHRAQEDDSREQTNIALTLLSSLGAFSELNQLSLTTMSRHSGHTLIDAASKNLNAVEASIWSIRAQRLQGILRNIGTTRERACEALRWIEPLLPKTAALLQLLIFASLN
jgi:hypothetical protein